MIAVGGQPQHNLIKEKREYMANNAYGHDEVEALTEVVDDPREYYIRMMTLEGIRPWIDTTKIMSCLSKLATEQRTSSSHLYRNVMKNLEQVRDFGLSVAWDPDRVSQGQGGGNPLEQPEQNIPIAPLPATIFCQPAKRPTHLKAHSLVSTPTRTPFAATIQIFS
ncbi:uncharacterized protein F4807DRAFT_35334 [Annulohypoxylon truncatum]|uniref:uncharacterized protein n=1 Tax=Annulohypoxylon truncatum TaxID=327061 RepID=UPI002008CEC2|nr:uncharacterized protein F4807DRAFT_35334 [Annulohypoxylon truncatum]KAI1211337.1 hypothetical protein F4807DRAFT_35334 [Annulohypoxylon truncatum]